MKKLVKVMFIVLKKKVSLITMFCIKFGKSPEFIIVYYVFMPKVIFHILMKLIIYIVLVCVDRFYLDFSFNSST